MSFDGYIEKDIEKAIRENDPIFKLSFYNVLISRGEFEKGFNGLISLLKEDKEYVRKEAAESLGKLRDKRAIEPLCQLFEDKSSEVRISAACVLGKLGDKRVLTFLNSLLKCDNKHTRVSVALSLWELGDKEVAVQSLISLLYEGDCYQNDQFVRDAVANALNKITGKSFIIGNNSPDKWHRWWAQNKKKFGVTTDSQTLSENTLRTTGVSP